MSKLLATVMALVFGMTFSGLGLVQAKDMPMEQSSSPAAEEKAMEDHGKAGDDHHGKTAEDQGKAGDDETKTAKKKAKKERAKKKSAS